MTTTSTARVPAAPPAEDRRLGLALRTELRLNAGRVATTLILCAAALAWAAIATDQYAGLLTLWAALAWYRYGRADTIEREELRASLGLSRADRVRGRVMLVLAEQAAVVLTVAAGAVLSVGLGRESVGGAAPFSFSGDPSGSQLWIVLAGALFSAMALLGTGIVVGGDCHGASTLSEHCGAEHPDLFPRRDPADDPSAARDDRDERRPRGRRARDPGDRGAALRSDSRRPARAARQGPQLDP